MGNRDSVDEQAAKKRKTASEILLFSTEYILKFSLMAKTQTAKPHIQSTARVRN